MPRCTKDDREQRNRLKSHVSRYVHFYLLWCFYLTLYQIASQTTQKIGKMSIFLDYRGDLSVSLMYLQELGRSNSRLFCSVLQWPFFKHVEVHKKRFQKSIFSPQRWIPTPRCWRTRCRWWKKVVLENQCHDISCTARGRRFFFYGSRLRSTRPTLVWTWGSVWHWLHPFCAQWEFAFGPQAWKLQSYIWKPRGITVA